DHVKLHRLEADPQGRLDPAQDGTDIAPPDVLEDLRVQRVNRHVHALQARIPQGLCAAGEHRTIRRHRNVGDVADGPVDDVLHVEPDERLAAGILHRRTAELPRRADDPIDLRDRHLVVVGHARREDRAKALVVAIDASEVAALRHADSDVRDLPPECVDEHPQSLSPRRAKNLRAARGICRWTGGATTVKPRIYYGAGWYLGRGVGGLGPEGRASGLGPLRNGANEAPSLFGDFEDDLAQQTRSA